MQSEREICRQIDAVSRTDGYYVTLSRYVRCIDISTRVNGLLSTGCPMSLRPQILHLPVRYTARLVGSCYNVIVDSNVAFVLYTFLFACLYVPILSCRVLRDRRKVTGTDKKYRLEVKARTLDAVFTDRAMIKLMSFTDLL